MTENMSVGSLQLDHTAVLAKQMEQLGRVHGTPWMPWQHSLRGTIKSAPFFFTKNLNVTKLVYSLSNIKFRPSQKGIHYDCLHRQNSI